MRRFWNTFSGGERQKVIEAFGTVDYYEDYDPKKYRK
jgi:hypothetical protein